MHHGTLGSSVKATGSPRKAMSFELGENAQYAVGESLTEFYVAAIRCGGFVQLSKRGPDIKD